MMLIPAGPVPAVGFRFRTRSLSALHLIAALLILFLCATPALAQDHPTLTLSLDEAIRLAADQGTAVQVARLETEEAAARVTQRRSGVLPHVSAELLEAGRTFNTVTFGLDLPGAPGEPPLFDPDGQVEGPVRTTDARVRISQPLLDPAAWRRIADAKAQVAATEARALAVAQSSAATAASAYVNAMHADAVQKARESDKELAEELLQIARARFDAGVGVDLDVTRARAQVASASAGLVAAEGARAQARLTLLRVLNLPMETELDLSDSLAGPSNLEASSSDTLALNQIFENRYDLEALRSSRDAATAGLSTVRAERLPSVDLVADAGAIGGSLSHMLGTYDWGLSLSLPLFEGRSRRGRLQEQEAVVSAIDLRLKDRRDQVRFELRKAAIDLASSIEQLDAAQTRVELAEQEVSQARERFRAGVAGDADVVTAIMNLSAARDMVVDARTAYQTARLDDASARGTLIQFP